MLEKSLSGKCFFSLIGYLFHNILFSSFSFFGSIFFVLICTSMAEENELFFLG